jgi:hypothetical protein
LNVSDAGARRSSAIVLHGSSSALVVIWIALTAALSYTVVNLGFYAGDGWENFDNFPELPLYPAVVAGLLVIAGYLTGLTGMASRLVVKVGIVLFAIACVLVAFPAVLLGMLWVTNRDENTPYGPADAPLHLTIGFVAFALLIFPQIVAIVVWEFGERRASKGVSRLTLASWMGGLTAALLVLDAVLYWLINLGARIMSS